MNKMFKRLKKLYYTLLFKLQLLLYSKDDKYAKFNLKFFFIKQDIIKYFRSKNQKMPIKYTTNFLILKLIMFKVKKLSSISRADLSLYKWLNFGSRIFSTILHHLIFGSVLIFYFFSTILNCCLLLIKPIFGLYLHLKLSVLKFVYDKIFTKFGFSYMFWLLNIYNFLKGLIICSIIFVAVFTIFKTNYFETDFFYVNSYNYDNTERIPLTSNDIYYHTFSLWWVVRIYLVYLLTFIFVKDLRPIIKEHLVFILILPVFIPQFNFKVVTFLLLSTILTEDFVNKRFDTEYGYFDRAVLRKDYFPLSYATKFEWGNFLFSNRLRSEYNRSKLLQASANVDVTSELDLDPRNEADSYKPSFNKINRLKTVTEYYDQFRVIEKRDKLLQSAAANRIIYDKEQNSLIFGPKKFPSATKKPVLIPTSPYLDVVFKRADNPYLHPLDENYYKFKLRNYYIPIVKPDEEKIDLLHPSPLLRLRKQPVADLVVSKTWKGEPNFSKEFAFIPDYVSRSDYKKQNRFIELKLPSNSVSADTAERLQRYNVTDTESINDLLLIFAKHERTKRQKRLLKDLFERNLAKRG